MPDTQSIVLVKAFTYRDAYEEFSNRYHFTSSGTSSYQEWKGLADAWIQIEKPTQPPDVSWVRAYCYDAGVDHSILQIDYTVPPNVLVVGTFVDPGLTRAAGDVAAHIRWDTNTLNSRGKRIYCRKYMHAVWGEPTDGDQLLGSQKTAFEAFAAKCIDGTLPQSARYCAPQGAPLQAPFVDTYLTTRTLKRRGKRPLPSGTRQLEGGSGM